MIFMVENSVLKTLFACEKIYRCYLSSECCLSLCFQSTGLAGFAVTTALNLNNRLSKWILSFCKLENKVIAIERINQYSEIPPEPPLIVENGRPPASWPQSGTVEIIDLAVSLSTSLKILHNALISYH
jgi:hypothetical protein